MTNFFLLITIILSILAFRDERIIKKLIFNPYIIHNRNQWYRFFSSGLIHADVMHLLINMLVLFSFGGIVESNYSEAFGERGGLYFFILYASSLVMSQLPTYNNHKQNPSYNSLGASGAVSAIVFAYILFDPLNKLCLYGIICLPGIIFGLIYIGYCIYMSKRGVDNINHSAHMWGALYGFAYTVLLKPSLLIEFFDKLIYFRNVI
jgi:membrane associated rhomboid family serine protease